MYGEVIEKMAKLCETKLKMSKMIGELIENLEYEHGQAGCVDKEELGEEEDCPVCVRIEKFKKQYEELKSE